MPRDSGRRRRIVARRVGRCPAPVLGFMSGPFETICGTWPRRLSLYQELAMSTHPLLNLSVLAGFTFTGFDDLSAQAADRQSAPTPAAPAAAQPKANPEVNRPLTANDVWGHDYAQARQQAKALNRPVLLHFHATWG